MGRGNVLPLVITRKADADEFLVLENRPALLEGKRLVLLGLREEFDVQLSFGHSVFLSERM